MNRMRLEDLAYVMTCADCPNNDKCQTYAKYYSGYIDVGMCADELEKFLEI